jgi:hypothetical protein
MPYITDHFAPVKPCRALASVVPCVGLWRVFRVWAVFRAGRWALLPFWGVSGHKKSPPVKAGCAGCYPLFARSARIRTGSRMTAIIQIMRWPPSCRLPGSLCDCATVRAILVFVVHIQCIGDRYMPFCFWGAVYFFSAVVRDNYFPGLAVNANFCPVFHFRFLHPFRSPDCSGSLCDCLYCLYC